MADDPNPPTAPAAAPPPRRAASPPFRKVASYRIDPELARRVKIYAATNDLNDVAVVKRALTDYLDRHHSGPGAEEGKAP